jgi:hypothetical protein
MNDIEKRIQNHKELLSDSNVSPQTRRHIKEDLIQLENYQLRHPENIHVPTCLELFCDEYPEADECRIYED